jgi:hypothetical protein
MRIPASLTVGAAAFLVSTALQAQKASDERGPRLRRDELRAMPCNRYKR